MAFSSLVFMFLFLPLALIFYYITPKKYRNITLLFENLIFYSTGSIDYVFILLSTIFINYVGGLLIEKAKNTILKKVVLGCFIGIDLLVLCYFKYFNFLVQNINNYLHSQIDLIHVIMPIGISFYTFMAISYLVDIYRKDVKAERNFLNFSIFLSLFTNILAGPINRYCTFYEQIVKRNENIQDFIYGTKRFIIGLGKKVIIANTLVTLSDKIFELPPNEYSILISWIGVFAYSLHLYFDFSGYSDMAIGVGRMFGFKIMENFNFPYISKTFTEFWRRWHISLSSWFKYYLYIPLGGNRCGNFRTYVNLFIVFFTTGLWHGANWTYIFWGLWNGIFMIIERYFNLAKKEFKNKLANIAMHVYCVIFVFLGFVLFRSETITGAVKYVISLVDFNSISVSLASIQEYLDIYTVIIFILAFIGCFGTFKNIMEWGEKNWKCKMIFNIYLLLIFFYSWCCLAASSYTPFVYFKF